MKACVDCGVSIGDAYERCASCNHKHKTNSVSNNPNNKEAWISEQLKHINWNLGYLQKWTKLSLLNNLESSKERTVVQDKIRDSLLEDLNKDIKTIKDIKKDEESQTKN